MKERLGTGETPEAARLWTATYVLMGLRYSETLTAQLLEGVVSMEESVTYQAILKRGAIREAQRFLLLLGQNRFGPPDEQVTQALQAINKVSRLEELGVRVAEVNSWQELLAPPAPRPRRRRRTHGGG
jgi:hypothetical protein